MNVVMDFMIQDFILRDDKTVLLFIPVA